MNRLILTVLVLSSLAGTASPRTWYVAADGSGDAPTIAAAVDSSSSGDVILVGPGTHFVSDIAGGGVNLKARTSLISESGPTTTFLKPGSPPDQPGLISARDYCVVTGFTILGLGNTQAAVFVRNNVEVHNCIIDGGNGTSAIAVAGRNTSIHHNVCLGGSGNCIALLFSFEGSNIYNNIILNGISNSDPCPTVQIQCNLINGPISPCPYLVYNFSADPMFCGAGNYFLQIDSPCVPGNHPDGFDCGLIGPLPVGCGPVRVDTKTWGSVKGMYRH